jgi:hypothetical protein
MAGQAPQWDLRDKLRQAKINWGQAPQGPHPKPLSQFWERGFAIL